ncbi:MAG: hypothetical protein JEZ03_15560 [Bacteroidales bacterium]|nr:hypothetical protein [Bacteroidales bacterium]
MEQTAIEILEKIARRTNRELVNSEQFLNKALLSRIPQSKRWVTIKDYSGSYFVGCDSSSASFNEYARISGVVIPVNLRHQNFTLKLSEKDIVDKLNIFKKHTKTKDKEVDRNFVIDTNDVNATKQLLQNTNLRIKLIKAFQRIPGLKLEINTLKLDHIPHLQGETFVSLYKKQWILEDKIIEELFELNNMVYERMLLTGVATKI